ncbi:MAG: methyl-accepting chemotaxis protein, partial [Pseudomonadota bacterium]
MNNQSLSLGKKIPAIITALVAISVAATALFGYYKGRKSVEQVATEKLVAVTEARQTDLATWFEGIEGDITVQSQNPLIREALVRFTEAWGLIQGNPEKTLQKLYIEDNPHPTGEKEKLDAASDGSFYSATHARYHPYVRAFLQDRGYYDIFLIDPHGNLIYSVFKELDYATNLLNGKWAKSDLGEAFRLARANPKADYHAFLDFKPYGPSHGAPASFISTPLLGDGGELLGVLAFQMPVGRLNKLIQQRAGLGEGGESYLVGSDGLMRSDSRLSKDSTLLQVKVETPQVRRAIAGETGTIVGTDRKGREVLATFAPFEFKGAKWAILTEVPLAEALAGVQALRNNLIVGFVIGLGLMMLITYQVGRSIAEPIRKMTTSMQHLAEGDLDVTIPGEERRDEIGSMAKALVVFRDAGQQKLQLEAERARSASSVQSAVSTVADALERLSKGDLVTQIDDELDVEFRKIREDFNYAVNELGLTMATVAGSAADISKSTQEIAAAAEDMSRRTEQQASTLAETSAAVRDINTTVHQTADAAKEAGKTAISAKTNAQNGGDIVRQAIQAMNGVESSSKE